MQRALVVSCFCLATVTCGYGCGSSTDTSDAAASSGSGGAGGGVPFKSAPHTSVPSVKKHGTGGYAVPGLVTITFPGYDQKETVESFGDWLVSSSYLTETLGEYGVTGATHTKVALKDAPPLFDSCSTEKQMHHGATCGDEVLANLLQDRVADGSLPSPVDDPEVVYMFYFPAGSQFNGGGVICESFDGYHSNAQIDGKTVVYAVIGECDGLINTISHEFAEAASDPEPYGPHGTSNGYYIDTPKLTDPWDWVTDDEIADLCEYFPSVTVDGWPVARIWSNKAVAADTDPCLPVPPDDPPYRDVSAVPTTLQKVARGKSTTFKLAGWSTSEIGTWSIFAQPEPQYTNEYGQSFSATSKLSADTITNGGEVTLTVTVPEKATVGGYGIVGIYNDQNYAEVWYVGVIATK